MKKLLFQLILIMTGVTVSSQIIMDFNGKKYDISKVDSIVFRSIEIPSAATCMEKTNEYRIFVEALRRTGLADSLITNEKGKEYLMNYPEDRDGNRLYYPKRCDVGWTIFAEKDSVFNANGINNFNDLVVKCKEWYGNPSWYDLLTERGITVSTGTDYTYEWNVVHIFVAYHIIRAKMAVDEIVYEKTEKNSKYWNYSFGYEPQAYYETMLSGTLVKVWATDTRNDHFEPSLWLNRYVKNNTLTDQYGTFGSDAMHPLLYSGAQVDRNSSIESLNAYIHSIDKLLLYDSNAYYAQHERMRFHVNQMLPELATNAIMRATPEHISNLNRGGDGNRVAFPTDFFENLRCYDEKIILRYNITNYWRALESTQLWGWNKYDFAIRLPHIPTGRYEIRYLYTPFARAGEIEFFIGNNSDSISMKKVSNFDATEDPYNGNIGYVTINPDEGEYGIESGKTMRLKGYMYAPASYSGGAYNSNTRKLSITDDDPYIACKKMTGSTSCRTEGGYGTMTLRFIIGVWDFKQSQDYWLRIKGRHTAEYNNQEYDDTGWYFSIIELVPIDVADNDTYMEDWY